MCVNNEDTCYLLVWPIEDLGFQPTLVLTSHRQRYEWVSVFPHCRQNSMAGRTTCCVWNGSGRNGEWGGRQGVARLGRLDGLAGFLGGQNTTPAKTESSFSHNNMCLCRRDYTRQFSPHTHSPLSLFLSSPQDVVTTIENTPTGPQDRPKTAVTIKDCGTLPLDKPFNIET